MNKVNRSYMLRTGQMKIAVVNLKHCEMVERDKEYDIDDIVVIDGSVCVVMKRDYNHDCDKCCMNGDCGWDSKCMSNERRDGKDVFFKLVKS